MDRMTDAPQSGKPERGGQSASRTTPCAERMPVISISSAPEPAGAGDAEPESASATKGSVQTVRRREAGSIAPRYNARRPKERVQAEARAPPLLPKVHVLPLGLLARKG